MATRSTGAMIAWLILTGCTVKSAREHYVVAERLWGDGNYRGAAAEFERAAAKDLDGGIGLQALFRAAMTQTLFLDRPTDAQTNLKKYLERSKDLSQTRAARLLLGEIMYSKLSQFEQVIPYYRSILADFPGAPEAPEILLRIGRAHSAIWQFDRAVAVFEELEKKFPKSPQAERAAYETGVAYFSGGEQRFSADGESGVEIFQQAIDSFTRFVRLYPSSPLVSDAKLMMANCHEELDQLSEAFELLKAIQPIYSAPELVRLRMRRIESRMARKNK